MPPSYHTFSLAVNGTNVLTASITQNWGKWQFRGSLGAIVGVKWGESKRGSFRYLVGGLSQ